MSRLVEALATQGAVDDSLRCVPLPLIDTGLMKVVTARAMAERECFVTLKRILADRAVSINGFAARLQNTAEVG